MEEQYRVLLVDDEVSILDYLSLGFRYEGFTVLTAETGLEALEQVFNEKPDLVVLDRMLPDLDGLSVCQRIREQNNDVPILVLSALGRTEQRVEGFQRGVDDYLPKPFKFEELLVRVQALLRRSGRTKDRQNLLRFGALVLNLDARTAFLGQRRLELTAKECDVLEYMLRNQGKVATRENLITHLWGFDYEGDTKVIDVHVSAIRQKLGDDSKSLIRTVRGVGYVLGE